MVPNGPKLSQMISSGPNDLKWFQMVSNKSKWSPKAEHVPNDTKWPLWASWYTLRPCLVFFGERRNNKCCLTLCKKIFSLKHSSQIKNALIYFEYFLKEGNMNALLSYIGSDLVSELSNQVQKFDLFCLFLKEENINVVLFCVMLTVVKRNSKSPGLVVHSYQKIKAKWIHFKVLCQLKLKIFNKWKWIQVKVIMKL